MPPTCARQRQTLTELRAMSYVKYLLNRCVICKCFNTRPYCYPKSPNLPSFRLDKGTPFSACGADYIRSLYTKNVYNDHQEDERQLFKCCVVLYKCAATRVVVLEFWKRLEKEFWKRLVSPVKRSMRKNLGNSTVCFNELQVLLYEIELAQNPRPLGFVYNNVLEEILTPAHLLFGRKLYACNSSIQDNVEINLYLPKRVHLINMLLNHFWSRWQKEYVTLLREYDKNKNERMTKTINK